MTSRSFFTSAILLLVCLLAGCSQNGQFTLFGYTTEPNYNREIHTVYVPIFQNVSFRRGLEFDLTRLVIREIESKTPYKVTSCRENADTELIGKIVNRGKGLININQLGETREAEVTVAVEVTWRDLRPGTSGEILSAPKPREQGGFGQPPITPPPPPPALIIPVAGFIPELGGSVTSAEWQVLNTVANRIVAMMERPW